MYRRVIRWLVNVELKGPEKKRSSPNLRYCSGICLDGLKDAMNAYLVDPVAGSVFDFESTRSGSRSAAHLTAMFGEQETAIYKDGM